MTKSDLMNEKATEFQIANLMHLTFCDLSFFCILFNNKNAETTQLLNIEC